MASSRANPRAGKILQGRYRLRSILAEGGMGVVWQGERLGIERPVVVKFLHAVMSNRPGALERFEREARATARLNHPNCVQLVDFGLEEQQPYLVVEFVDGLTLAQQLDHGPLDPRRAVRIVIQVLAGLIHAHDRGILHRDLKPANIMIVEAVGFEDFVKILDFGLAKIIDETDRKEVTVHGVALGTPGYMSPEQAAGMPSDLRSDLYSSGAVLYHLLTGVKIFEGGNVHSILRKHREQTPAPPRKLRGPGSISSELDAVVSKAMQRDPAKRFQSAAEMRRALEQTPEGRSTGDRRNPGARRAVAVEEDGTRVARGSRPARPAPPAASRSTWPLVAGVGLVAMALGAGGVLLLHPPPTTSIETVSAEAAAADLAPVVTAIAERKSPTVTAAPVEPVRPPVAQSVENPEDGIDDDLRLPPEPPATAPTRAAHDVHSIADVRALVRRGETDSALAGLYALRRRPQSRDVQSEIATLLGHLYFDRGWATDSLKEYRYALALDPNSRNDQTIVDNTVQALGDPATSARARRVLVDGVGRSAIPALRRAATDAKTSAQAAIVLDKLGVGPTPAP